MRTRADLLIVVEGLEAELKEANRLLQEERERWKKLQAKVEETLGNLDRTRKRVEAELVIAADKIRVAKPQEHEAATAQVMFMVEEVRRAYAMYTVICSAKIWMENCL